MIVSFSLTQLPGSVGRTAEEGENSAPLGVVRVWAPGVARGWDGHRALLLLASPFHRLSFLTRSSSEATQFSRARSYYGNSVFLFFYWETKTFTERITHILMFKWGFILIISIWKRDKLTIERNIWVSWFLMTILIREVGRIEKWISSDLLNN